MFVGVRVLTSADQHYLAVTDHSVKGLSDVSAVDPGSACNLSRPHRFRCAGKDIQDFGAGVGSLNLDGIAQDRPFAIGASEDDRALALLDVAASDREGRALI